MAPAPHDLPEPVDPTPPDVDAPWMGLHPASVAPLFDALGLRWWVAGGWAIELAVGRPPGDEVRAHADLDIALPRVQEPLLASLSLAGWECFIADDGTLVRWDGGLLEDHQWQFWVREPGGGRWAFELMLEDIDLGAATWRYRRDRDVTLPLDAFGIEVQTPVEGGTRTIPVVSPQVALLYKSKDPTGRHQLDFNAALPLLNPPARAWLSARIARADPEHPWLAALAGAE